MGYKLPTVFQDESEMANYRHVLPIADSVRAELSVGGTFDLSVRPAARNGWYVEVNELVFFTRILHPLLTDTSGGHISYYNANGYIQGVGLETALRLGYRGANPVPHIYPAGPESEYRRGPKYLSAHLEAHLVLPAQL
jgi:hypothetical protein